MISGTQRSRESARHRRDQRATLAIVGVGAFGAFMAPHLARHHDVVLCDPSSHIDQRATALGLDVVSLDEAARCQIVVLAAPVQALGSLLQALAPKLMPGCVIVDVCSVKVKPAHLMLALLPPYVDIVCTHPLFGPATGRHGIAGCNIALANIRGHSEGAIRRFLRDVLGLRIIATSPEGHDHDAAHVQGLTHFISRTIASMALPDLIVPRGVV